MIIASPCWAESSSLQVLDQLYMDGRPQSGEAGTVNDFTAWRNCLYVSYAAANGNFYLDVWNITNFSDVRFVEEHFKGNLFEDQNDNLPDAQLLSPRDMTVMDSKLIYWRNFRAEVYYLNSNCSIENQDHGFSFPDGMGSGLNRLSYGGHMAASRVTDQNGESSYELINLQDPLKAFKQSTPELNDQLNGSFQGLPALATLSDDKTTLKLKYYKQERINHVSGFWEKNILGQIFDLSNGNLSLNEIINSILTEELLSAEQQRIFDIFIQSDELGLVSATTVLSNKQLKKRRKKLKRKLRRLRAKLRGFKANTKRAKAKKVRIKVRIIKLRKRLASLNDSGDAGQDNDSQPPRLPLNDTLGQIMLNAHESDVKLGDLFSQYGIAGADSVELALQKIVAAHLSNDLDAILKQNVLTDLLPLLTGKLYSFPNQSIAELEEMLKGILDNELHSAGVVRYLLDTVLAPFYSNPTFMQVSLGDMLREMTNNNVADMIDESLGLARILMPSQLILDLLDFDAPACLSVPGSARQFLELILVHSGPELKLEGPAFWEMMKAVQFYYGNTNFSSYEVQLDNMLRVFHGLISKEVVEQALSFIKEAQDLNQDFSGVHAEFGADFSVTELISRLIAKDIADSLKSHYGENIGSSRVSQFIKIIGINADFAVQAQGAESPTLKDLVDAISDSNLTERTLSSVIEGARKTDLNFVQKTLALPLERTTSGLFGEISLDTDLDSAISGLILGRMDPSIFANLIKGSLGTIFTRMDAGESLISLLGPVGLAAQGDCISQWMVAIHTVSVVASGSVVFEGAGIALEAANAAIELAYELAIKHALGFVFSEFVEGIFNDAHGSYRSWYTAIREYELQVNLEELSGRATRIVDTAIYRDSFVAIYREIGFMGAMPGDDRRVSALILNPEKPAQTARVIELGEWLAITSVKSNEDYLMVSGVKDLANGQMEQAVLVLKFTDPAAKAKMLFGPESLPFSGTSQFKVVHNGESFAINSALGGIVFFSGI